MKKFLLLVPDLPSFLLGVKFNNILVEMTKNKSFYKFDLYCFGGGIGRRAGFKIQYPRGCVGSSPTLGTKKEQPLNYKLGGCFFWGLIAQVY